MNTIVTFTILIVLLAVAMILVVGSDVPRWWIAGGGVAFALAIPPLIDPLTRTLWTAIDIGMRPLEAHEVDWTVVAPEVLGNTSTGTGLPLPGVQNRDLPNASEHEPPITPEDS